MKTCALLLALSSLYQWPATCMKPCTASSTSYCCTGRRPHIEPAPELTPSDLEEFVTIVRESGWLDGIRRMDLGDFWKRPLRRGARDHLGDFWKRPFPPSWREAADQWRGSQALDSEGR